MRLTIGNLFISEQWWGNGKRSAGILARKPDQLNPPYAGCRVAAAAGYKIRDATVARRVLSSPAPQGAGEKDHTAILRCRTGAPTVRLSAASMMALASMPWWR